MRCDNSKIHISSNFKLSVCLMTFNTYIYIYIYIYIYTGLLKMIVGVLTTCYTQYTWDSSIRIFLFNPLNPELNPICYLLALLVAQHFLHVSRIRVQLLTFRRLMSYIYGAPILDVSRSHTTTQHSR